MPISLFSIVIALHVLSATFWAGSTFTLARTNGKSAEQLFVPQLSAAVVAILAGVYLWARMFPSGGEPLLLRIGAGCAILAAIVQAVLVGRVKKRLASDEHAVARAATAHRIASGLLAITIVSMVIP
jgi:hypothetical protein